MRLLSHVKRHSVGYVALFCALTGTGWAATSLPRPAPSPPRASIAAAPRGYVLAWAHVNANGRVVSGSPGASAYATGGGEPKSDDYNVRWRGLKSFGRCVPMVTLGQSMYSSASSANASIGRGAVRSGHRVFTVDEVGVVTANAQGQGVSTPFFVAVIC